MNDSSTCLCLSLEPDTFLIQQQACRCRTHIQTHTHTHSHRHSSQTDAAVWELVSIDTRQHVLYNKPCPQKDCSKPVRESRRKTKHWAYLSVHPICFFCFKLQLFYMLLRQPREVKRTPKELQRHRKYKRSLFGADVTEEQLK